MSLVKKLDLSGSGEMAFIYNFNSMFRKRLRGVTVNSFGISGATFVLIVRTMSITVTSGGARNLMGGPQVPAPLLT